MKEGCTFLLISEFPRRPFDLSKLIHFFVTYSAGQVGPTSQFFNKRDAPENKTVESTGMSLFNNESFEAWGDHYAVNAASIFFVTTAFMGLLAKGSDDEAGYWSSIVNTTSISGVIKLAQDHVSSGYPNDPIRCIDKVIVLLQQRQSCCDTSDEDVLH